MTKENEMPDEIWVWEDTFDNDVQGEWSSHERFQHDSNTKYVRAQLLPVDRQEALKAFNRVTTHATYYDHNAGEMYSEQEYKDDVHNVRAALSKPNDVEGLDRLKQEREIFGKFLVDGNYDDPILEVWQHLWYAIDTVIKSQGYLSQPKEEWRDIESAPKDGSHILITDGEDTMIGWLNKKGHCYVSQYDSDSIPAQTKITHWMPLPTPPNAQQEDK